MEKAFSFAVTAIRLYALLGVIGVIANARVISTQFGASFYPDRVPAAEIGIIIFLICANILIGVLAKMIASFAISGMEEGESFWSTTVLRTGLRLTGLHFFISTTTALSVMTVSVLMSYQSMVNPLDPLSMISIFLGIILTLLANQITNAFRKADQKAASPTV